VGNEIFAFRMKHTLTLQALGVSEIHAKEYAADMQVRQAKFLTALINSRISSDTFDLRMIYRPQTARDQRPPIDIVLLCRSDAAPPDEMSSGKHFLHLLNATFPEFWFEKVSESEVARYCDPFPIVHLVAITRRSGLEPLDSLKRRPDMRLAGFNRTPVSPAGLACDEDKVLHIFPFAPTGAPFTTVFKLLLYEQAPVVISTRVRPTSLSFAEESLLEEYIARCERYIQASLGPASEDLSRLQPTLKEQAQQYMHYLVRLLFGLKDNAGLFTIQIGSPAQLSRPLIELVGSLISAPAGSLQTSDSRPMESSFAGGYEIYDQSNIPESIASIKTLNMVLPVLSGLPAGSERLPHLFDSIEGATAFRFPPPTVEAPIGVSSRPWKSLPLTVELSKSGVLLGMAAHPMCAKPVRLGMEDRRRHIYVTGQTGTGKTTLLKSMILEDMRKGEGLCVVDPHGDLYQELLECIPASRVRDVVLFDPSDTENPAGINMLEYKEESERHFLVQELTGIMQRMMFDEYGPSAASMVGPVFYLHMRMNLLLAMSNPETPGTLLEFYTIFQGNNYWKRWLPLRTKDPMLARWVENVLPQTDYLRPGSDSVGLGAYITSKFEGFVFDPRLRRIFGQKHSTINFRNIMDEGRILLVNLAKGVLTDANANFLGMVLMAKLMAAATGRVSQPAARRRDFHLYVDEFQNIATQNFVTLLSEARKFGLNLILVNQFLSQIQDKRIIDAIFGNVGTLVTFRLGQVDAERFEQEFFPYLNRFDFVNLPNWEAYVSTIVHGQNVPPFSIETIHTDGVADKKARQAAVRRSRRVHGRPRALVDLELLKSSAGATVADGLTAIKSEPVLGLCLGSTVTKALEAAGITKINDLMGMSASDIAQRADLVPKVADGVLHRLVGLGLAPREVAPKAAHVAPPASGSTT
jgi:hypothetical protein